MTILFVDEPLIFLATLIAFEFFCVIFNECFLQTKV